MATDLEGEGGDVYDEEDSGARFVCFRLEKLSFNGFPFPRQVLPAWTTAKSPQS